MRGQRSRFAVLALALAFGAAGTLSSGSTPTDRAASCSVDRVAGGAAAPRHAALAGTDQRTAAGEGWQRTEPERGECGCERGRHCRRAGAVTHVRLRQAVSASTAFELPGRRSGGLLGLGTSPANAPPGS
jgi:hypothetical protein